MLAEMSASQLAEWREFYGVEPWGEDRADLRAGIVASTVANCNRAKDSEPFTPADFMPYVEREPEPEMTDEQRSDAIAALLMAAEAAAG